MRLLYLASVWIHILAATVWVGGIFFVALVVVPWLKSGDADVGKAGALMRKAGERFRTIGWICFGILLVTGSLNLWFRGIRPGNLVDPTWWSSSVGLAAGLKVVTFLLVVGVSAIHDFRVGPEATVAMETAPDAPETTALRRRAALLGRLNGVLALLLVGLGVVLVRGWP